MKTRRIWLLIFLLSPIFLKAQLSLLPSVGVQIPTGDFAKKNYFGSDFGFNLALKYRVSETFDIGLLVGYHRFSHDLELQTNSVFPIATTIEKRFGEEQFKPLIGIDMGMFNFYHTETIKREVSNLSISKTTSYAGIAPAVGFCYDFSSNFGLHAVAKYHYLYQKKEPLTYATLNIGINIRFGNEPSKYSLF